MISKPRGLGRSIHSPTPQSCVGVQDIWTQAGINILIYFQCQPQTSLQSEEMKSDGPSCEVSPSPPPRTMMYVDWSTESAAAFISLHKWPNGHKEHPTSPAMCIPVAPLPLRLLSPVRGRQTVLHESKASLRAEKRPSKQHKISKEN